jgi:GNAT superfamily N-acetyltransferase
MPANGHPEVNGATRITPFASRHAAGVARLILSIQREEFGFPITLADQPDLSDITGFYQKGAGNFWVALHGDEVVGSIALLDIGNSEAALRKMFVAAAFRGGQHGVAKRLLDVLFEWARTHGVERVFLGTTDKFRAAHRFYEKNGFLEITRGELPVAFPFMKVDSKFYVATLPA